LPYISYEKGSGIMDENIATLIRGVPQKFYAADGRGAAPAASPAYLFMTRDDYTALKSEKSDASGKRPLPKELPHDSDWLILQGYLDVRY